MDNTVQVSLSQYNDLRDENKSLSRINKQLEDAINALQARDGQKVFIRETYTFEDDDDNITTDVEISVKDFDEVKADVENFYKMKFAETEQQIEQLTQDIKKLKQESGEWAKKAMVAEMEVSRLKHRNLWQRTLNK